jgi:hypothetical protein
MKNTTATKNLASIFSILALSFMVTTSSFSADFYTAKITQVVPRAASGDVFVQFVPGTGETRFTALSRGILVGTDTGTNKVMAVLLTAITLNTDVTLLMDLVPSFATAQVIQSAGLKAP